MQQLGTVKGLTTPSLKMAQVSRICFSVHSMCQQILVAAEVLGISLKGQRMVIALGVQDFVDRKATAAGSGS